MCGELTTTNILHPTATQVVKDVQKIRSEVEPGKKGIVEEMCFEIKLLFVITLL